MSTWPNARFDILYYDDKADSNEPCEVILAGDELTVSYYNEHIEGYVIYKGKEIAPGHFELTAPMVKGHATLHRFLDAEVLVGEWIEDGYKGMWRIELN
ncbi:hypothetical protein [Rhodanobacter aciditrophus]|uniref:hypothetical protein n=1 Tax=Rhodanobacter aciditrophus TaxID=1623218 RepID=UPI003CF6D7D6